jgi:putative transposase
VSERYAFVRAEKACSGFPVARGCWLLKVSASGYYSWRDRPVSAAAVRRVQVGAAARVAFDASDETHGYRRVHRDLVEAGHRVSVDLVRRVMRDADLAAVQPAAFKVTTRQDPDAVAAPDLIERDFSSLEPGTRLVGDITYIRTMAGWAYLAVVIDLATKMIIGWQLGNRATAGLCVDALEMARRNGYLVEDAIFHTDRGCQYTSNAFQKCCATLKVRQSMGRTGVCWDNAQAESFFARLKIESIHRSTIETLSDARDRVARYIEIFYNRRRRHSALDYQTPHQRYLQLTQTAAQAAA